mmetsp:Transcript_38251/g.93786  ORF Transcript_38251/g.93786 Transcript_38251/m.93786 type:complete len:356 (+) Transcript_38251:113-1180(+)
MLLDSQQRRLRMGRKRSNLLKKRANTVPGWNRILPPTGRPALSVGSGRQTLRRPSLQLVLRLLRLRRLGFRLLHLLAHHLALRLLRRRLWLVAERLGRVVGVQLAHVGQRNEHLAVLLCEEVLANVGMVDDRRAALHLLAVVEFIDVLLRHVRHLRRFAVALVDQHLVPRLPSAPRQLRHLHLLLPRSAFDAARIPTDNDATELVLLVDHDLAHAVAHEAVLGVVAAPRRFHHVVALHLRLLHAQVGDAGATARRLLRARRLRARLLVGSRRRVAVGGVRLRRHRLLRAVTTVAHVRRALHGRLLSAVATTAVRRRFLDRRRRRRLLLIVAVRLAVVDSLQRLVVLVLGVGARID